MIRLFFVGDGQRDAVTVPRLVEGILGVTINAETDNWQDLRLAGGGYPRKFLYAMRRAKARGLAGIVATVDTDRARNKLRLRELRKAREEERSRLPAFPAAIGQADPHGEAWLLDDPVAVRAALDLAATVEIGTVRRTKDPKEELETLRRASPRSGDRLLDLLTNIARAVQSHRCVHARETGFHAFEDEVKMELGLVASECGPDCRCGDACAP